MSDEQHPAREEPMVDAGVTEDRPLIDPVAVGPGDPAPDHAAAVPGVGGGADPAGSDASGPATPDPALGGGDGVLLALVDRLAAVLERTDLGELEVAAGGTTIVLRAPSAVDRPAMVAVPGAGDAAAAGPVPAPAPEPATPAAGQPAARPSVRAPLTGIYYGAPSPGATPYVAVGDHVSIGQIIGLIEAMKLFNEIKSDLAGRVTRICADNGMLVKARPPLIEVEPA
jgi:acetyl-CoA carboxylase biotin carboxyl carrier protein